MRESLAEAFLKYLNGFPGAPERQQIANLLKEAKRFTLEEAVVTAIARTIRHAPQTIERNLDFGKPPSECVWIEFSDAGRHPQEGSVLRDTDAKIPSRMGYLLTKHPTVHATVGVIAWEFANGSVHNSPAMLVLNHGLLDQHARRSRLPFAESDGAGASMRILEKVQSFVPPGLRTEIELLHDDPAHAETAAMKDATSEAVFILGMSLLQYTSAWCERKEPDGNSTVFLNPQNDPAVRMRPSPGGFRRGLVSRGLTWSLPA